MINQPLVIGSTYRLKFKSTFERHGVCTTPGVTCLHAGGGVFRLEQITNFRDIVLTGVKLYDVFFSPLGITEDEYRKYFDGKPDDVLTKEYETKVVSEETTDKVSKTVNGNLVLVEKRIIASHEVHHETGKSIRKRHYNDKIDYASHAIYKFVDVVDSNDIIYVPELTLDTFPEIDIRNYRDLSLVVHLGYLDDPRTLDPMLLAIRERMAAYGWRPKNVRLYSTGSKWMSPSEYDAIKELRIPATVEVIDDDNKTEMLGKITIMNGALKQLVDTIQDPVTEVDINDVMVHDKTIDNRLFLVPCADGDVFVTGEKYYVEDTRTVGTKTIKVKSLLQEGVDYNVGDPCISYIISTDTTPSICKNYELHDNGYTQIPYGYNTTYPAEKMLKKIIQQAYVKIDNIWTDRDFEVTYYIKEADNYRAATDADFKQQFKRGLVYYERQDCVAGASLVTPTEWFGELYTKNATGEYVVTTDTVVQENTDYYRRIDDTETYEKLTHWFVESTDTFCEATKQYYILIQGSMVFRRAAADAYNWFLTGVDYYTCEQNDVTYRQATEEEILDPNQVLYMRNPYSFIEVPTRVVGVTYVRTDVMKENYGTVEALSLMGFRMTFDDIFGQSKTITLQLEDIIDLASKELNVVLPDKDYDYETFWKKYDGRKFRWIEYPIENDHTVKDTLDVVISRDTIDLLSKKSGTLLGQSGQVFKELYIKDDNQQKRNYYMRYVIQQKTVEDQKARISGLEQALIQLQAVKDNLAKENEELRKLIENQTTP